MDVTLLALVAIFGIQQAVTIGVAAQGELITEKSGVLNIGLEGVMLMSAFSGAVANWFFGPALGVHSPLAGIVAGIATGVGVNFLFAFMSTKIHVDQVIAGIGVNVFALGITFVISALKFTVDGTPIADTLQPLFTIRGLSANLSIQISPLDVALFVLPILTYLLLFRTKFGLRVRAVGENPRAAEAAGVNVANTRILATSVGGALLGLSGAYLTTDLFSSFVPDITEGIGFIALAAVIAGAWKPAYVLGMSLLFGVTVGLINVVQVTNGPLYYLLFMLPYIATILVLALASKRLRPPAALALPYKKE